MIFISKEIGLVSEEGLRAIQINAEGFLVFTYADGGKFTVPDKDLSYSQYEEICANVAYDQKMQTKHRRSHEILIFDIARLKWEEYKLSRVNPEKSC